MSYDDSFALGAELSQRGLPRLSEPELVSYATLRSRLLASSDETCAAMVGSGDLHAAMAAFDALSDDELRAFMRITTHAQSLELAGGPRPVTPEAARSGAAQAHTSCHVGMPPSDLPRLLMRASSNASSCAR